MKKNIPVNLPVNVTEEDKHIFQNALLYEEVHLSIKKLKNVFVTYSGLCVNGNGLIKESYHGDPKHYKDFLADASYYYYEAIDHSKKLIELHDENIYLVIHHPWFNNYYHWMCECILRLWLVRDKVNDMILVLPAHYKSTDYIIDSIEPFKLKNIFCIPDSKSLYVKNICIPQVKPVIDSYDRNFLIEIRKFYLQYVETEKKINNFLGDRVYISRKKASRKKIENEEEIEKILRKYDFVTVYNEDFSFLQQVAIYSHVRLLVSIHGAGLTNMMFMQNQSRVFELHKKKTNTQDWYSFAFWYMADALGFTYYQQICDPTDPNADFFHANLIVNLSTFERNIKLMTS